MPFYSYEMHKFEAFSAPNSSRDLPVLSRLTFLSFSFLAARPQAFTTERKRNNSRQETLDMGSMRSSSFMASSRICRLVASNLKRGAGHVGLRRFPHESYLRQKTSSFEISSRYTISRKLGGRLRNKSCSPCFGGVARTAIVAPGISKCVSI